MGWARVMNKEAVKLIKREEGFKSEMYQDTLGNWTLGHGITNLTEEESAAVVAIRVEKLEDALRDEYSWFHRMNEGRQAVLVSMAYQLGLGGLSKFKKMIAALGESDYHEAAKEGLDSRWARQTPARAERAMDKLRRG